MARLRRSKTLHQSPFVDLALTFITQLVQYLARYREAAAGLNEGVRHGPGQVIMNGRSTIGERGQGGVALQFQEVLDGRVRGTVEPAVHEHVRAYLGHGTLEEHEVGVVHGAMRPIAEMADRKVEGVQGLTEVRQSGVKLERLGKLRSQ